MASKKLFTSSNVSRETPDGSPACRNTWAAGHYAVDWITGETIEINCKSWKCERHRSGWLHKWRVVVSRETQINPIDRLLTLTFAENVSRETMMLAKQLLFRRLRAAYGSFEYFAVLEYTVRTRLPHLHILARSLYVPQPVLADFWWLSTHEAGCDKPASIVYIEKPRSVNNSVLYALKYALDAQAKNQDIPESWDGRKVTYSRGFFKSASVAEHWANYIRETFPSNSVSRETLWEIRENGQFYERKGLTKFTSELILNEYDLTIDIWDYNGAIAPKEKNYGTLARKRGLH
jgi:hypothetical protein